MNRHKLTMAFLTVPTSSRSEEDGSRGQSDVALSRSLIVCFTVQVTVSLKELSKKDASKWQISCEKG